MPKSHVGSSSRSGSTTTDESKLSIPLRTNGVSEHEEVNKRLVNWMADLILDNIKKVVCSNSVSAKGKKSKPGDLFYQPEEGNTCFDEVQNVIEMAKFEGQNGIVSNHDFKSVTVDEETVESLRSYVTAIAALYRKNPFHNFEVSSLYDETGVTCFQYVPFSIFPYSLAVSPSTPAMLL